jgi:FMN-dependent NADH-azoreductase
MTRVLLVDDHPRGRASVSDRVRAALWARDHGV